MAEGGDELRATVERLHRQLGDAESLDEGVRARLRTTLEELSEALEREAGREEHESLADRLNELTQDFEESHPTLAEAVGRVIHMLANLGI